MKRIGALNQNQIQSQRSPEAPVDGPHMNSPYRAFCGRIGLVASLTVAIGSLTAVACIMLFDLSWAHGVWVGHRELVLYRDRLDFRFAAQTPTPIFGLAAPSTEAEAQQIAENWRDGITSNSMAHLRWLSLPAFDFSLWWGISTVLFAACWWLLRRQIPRVGFPIGGSRDTRGGAGYGSARGVGWCPAGGGDL